MPHRFEFCLPTVGITVPAGPDWLHEVKYVGYGLRLERDDDRGSLNSAHIPGTLVPVEEPSTASKADLNLHVTCMQ